MAATRRAATGRRTPSADVERALIDAAERVLVREGPDGVTVRAVATEAGVAPMGVYNHLDGKPGLMNALLERGFQGLREAVTITGGDDAMERLRESGRGYRRFALSHPQHYAVMFDRAAAPPPDGDSEGAAAFDALVAHVREVMDAGAAVAGDPQEVAVRIWCTVHGAVSLELRGFLDPDSAPAMYERLLDFILRAIATQR